MPPIIGQLVNLCALILIIHLTATVIQMWMMNKEIKKHERNSHRPGK
jgi:hypothetical protein